MHSETQVPPIKQENPVSLPVLNKALKKVLDHVPSNSQTVQDEDDAKENYVDQKNVSNSTQD